MNNYYLAIVNYARFALLEDSDEEEENVLEKIENFAEVTVPNLNDRQFQQHFRLTTTTFEDIILKARQVFRHHNNNVAGVGYPKMDIQKEFLISLWYLGNMESFRSVSDRFGVTKSTCWDVLNRTCKLILQINMDFQIIVWPNRDRQARISNYFNSHGFTGIIGCIDGSHIKIAAPLVNKNSYINRKGFHSLLLQGICDHKKLFTDVYTGEVGSLHDYTLYRKSVLYREIQNGNIIFFDDRYLIGDLAYKLCTNLLVGFKNNGHLTAQQKKFNVILSKKRVKIENAFALLKGRFRRLKFTENVKMEMIVLIIITSCILHNTCILNGDNANDIMNVEEEMREERENDPANFLDIDEEQIVMEAIAKRYNIVNALRLD